MYDVLARHNVPGAPGALAITHVDGYGTGCFRRSTSWYRIARGEPTRLLSYPVSFYVSGQGPVDVTLTSKLLHVPSILGSGSTLDLEFEVGYQIGIQFNKDDAGSALFEESGRLSLEWSDLANGFIPHTSADDFARIQAVWLEGLDGFIRRNRVRLGKLAVSGTDQQRRFIRNELLREQNP